MTKPALRDQALAARAAAHEAGLDPAAQDALRRHLEPWRGRPLSGYLPIRTEIDPGPVMAAWDGPVGVPVIEGRGLPLTFALWTPETELTRGTFGAAIPARVEPMRPEVLIVPLVAFDNHGGRIGYGGGFYDRTLARLRAAGPVHAVGFAYAAQEVPLIPVDATDETLDAVVTEAGEVALSPRPGR